MQEEKVSPSLPYHHDLTWSFWAGNLGEDFFLYICGISSHERRKYTDDVAGEDASNVAITLRYPYHTLPRLKCQLHPKFAIFNAGIKLAELRGNLDKLGKIFEECPSLVKVEKLYNAWIQKIPDDALNDRSYVDPDEELRSEERRVGKECSS